MAILAHLDRTVVAAEQESVIDLVGRVGRIGIGLPLEVAERTALTSVGPDEAVFSAVIRLGLEPLADVIWLEDSCAAWPKVSVGGCQGRPKVGFGRHVADRIVNEDRIERPSEPQGPHVTDEMFSIGVDGAAQLEHLGRQIGQSEAQVSAEVRGGVAAARSKL